MNSPLKQFQRLLDRQEIIEHDKEAWLRAQGWEHSSDYPGALWLWRKTFPQSEVQWRWKDGEKVPHPGFYLNGVSTEVALRIEAAWLDVWTRGDHEKSVSTKSERVRRDWCEQHNRGSLAETDGLCPECEQMRSAREGGSGTVP